jgi:DNA-directed RNA polymerase beta subunit/DNA-directed RNA polymerase beta' subunit
MQDSEQPDWISMQYDSFQRFFSKADPPPIISLQSFIDQNKKNDISWLSINSWDISEPLIDIDECLQTNRSYERKLNIALSYPFKKNEDVKGTIKIPAPTPDGEFIIKSNGLKANRYVLVMDFAPLPGIQYRIRKKGTSVERQLTIKPFCGKQYEFILNNETEEKTSDYSYRNYNFLSINGKKQIVRALGDNTVINVNDPFLTKAEFDYLHELFEKNLIDEVNEIDERSMINLKVNLISDHLYSLFYISMSEILTRIEKELFVQPLRLLQKSVKLFFKNSNLFQLIDSTNPLSEISHKRKLTLTNHPGFPDNGLLLKKRDVHPTDFGRICSIESPQGKKLGFNLFLAKNAKINPDGMITVPFKKIDTGEDHFYDPIEEIEQISTIRMAGEKNDERLVFVKKPNCEVALQHHDDSIGYEIINKHCFLGYSASLIPFIQHNDGNRALMGANMMKQAVLLRDPEPPLVRTGFEAIIAEKYNHPTSPFIKDNQLCLGRNFLVGYLPWDLLNFEDGIVISDRLVNDGLLNHIEREEIISDQLDGEKIILGKIISIGSKVNEGDVLVVKSKYLIDNKDDIDKKCLHIGIKRKLEDHLLYAPEGLSGTVTDCSIYASRKFESELSQVVDKRIKIHFTKNLPSESSLRVVIVIERDAPVQVGDKLTGRHGNKGVVSAILPEHQMPYFYTKNNGCSCTNCTISEPHTHLEVLLNPLGVTGRMNVGQLYETAVGWIAKHTAEREGITVEPFSTEWSWSRIKQTMAENRLCPKQKLFYYKNGEEKPIGIEPSNGLVTVGYQYILKLSQLAEKKITSRSQKDREYSISMGQPVIPLSPPTEMGIIWGNKKSKKRKAQRLGEMEVWALQGHSAWNMLDEFLFLKSDAEIDRSDFVEYIKGTCSDFQRKDCYQREHRAFESFIHYCRALGLEIEANDTDGRHVNIIGGATSSNWQELKSFSIRIASNAERKRWANGHEIKSIADSSTDGLWSNKIFGDLSKSVVEKKTNDAYGIIRLPTPIDNPLFTDFLIKLADELFAVRPNMNVSNGTTDLFRYLSNIKWNDIIQNIKPISCLYRPIKKIIQNNYSINDFFIENLLVLPKSLRNELNEINDNNYPRYSNDLNYLYKEIIQLVQRLKYKKNKSDADGKYVIDVITDHENIESITNNDPMAAPNKNYDSDFKVDSGHDSQDIKRLRILVHALLVNGKMTTPVLKYPLTRRGTYKKCNSILASIAGNRTGKNGVIRKHLLGKRTDFSARAVIVPDPELGINEAAIPYKMAINLFEPLIFRRYSKTKERGRASKYDQFIKNNESRVKEFLQDIFKDHLLVLNRAPSLHRLSMLSFKARLHDGGGDVIRLNPYVCKAYNADFDGDTMSVFVPMLEESKAEAIKMLPSNCLRTPASGNLMISASADIGLGWYFFDKSNDEDLNKIKSAMGATWSKDNSLIKNMLEAYLNNPNFEDGLKKFTDQIRPVLCGCGLTIGLDDFSVNEDVGTKIKEARKMIGEKLALSSENDCADEIHEELKKINDMLSAESLTETSNLRTLKKSGSARVDLMQLVGMKSYQLRPGGQEAPCPILSNIFEGLSPLEYFNSSHGSRYGLSDKGLSTAVAGALTNILVQAVQDTFIVEEDCGTENGLYLSEFNVAGAEKIPLQNRIINRCLAEDIKIDDEMVKNGTMIDDPRQAEKISKIYNWVKIRSPIFCESAKGVCQKCYGHDLSTGKAPEIGYPAGIIAAQSIGEPGTQLVLKSFHHGGAAGIKPSLGIEKAQKIFYGKELFSIPNRNMTLQNSSDQKKAELAENLLFSLQVIYSAITTISDHHFEIIIRKMLSSGDIKGIVNVGQQDQGVLAKLSFRNFSTTLIDSAIDLATDELQGLKERVIAGKRIMP